MIGIHVATICSGVVASCSSGAVGGDAKRLATIYSGVVAAGEDDEAHWQSQCVRSYPVPSEGSAYSPQTVLEHFHFEEYAPELFAEIRRLVGVGEADYMSSLCRTDFEFIKFG